MFPGRLPPKQHGDTESLLATATQGQAHRHPYAAHGFETTQTTTGCPCENECLPCRFAKDPPPSRALHHHLPAEILFVVVAARPSRHYMELSSAIDGRSSHNEAELEGVDC